MTTSTPLPKRDIWDKMPHAICIRSKALALNTSSHKKIVQSVQYDHDADGCRMLPQLVHSCYDCKTRGLLRGFHSKLLTRTAKQDRYLPHPRSCCPGRGAAELGSEVQKNSRVSLCILLVQ